MDTRNFAVVVVACFACGPVAVAQGVAAVAEQPAAGAKVDAKVEAKALSRETPDVARRSVELILKLQQGDGAAEWAYEGVYRVGGEIPIGYRIGGTSISARALLAAPGYGEDDERKAAVLKALDFVSAGMAHPLMDPAGNRGYDVRGWGYTYALDFLCAIKRAGAVPEGRGEAVEKAIVFCVDAIVKIEIPKSGGWNYARGPRPEEPAPASPFMTAPTLQALIDAAALGFVVDGAVIERGLKSLEGSRAESGVVVYSGEASERTRDRTPGAVGRMLCVEVTLAQGGRGSTAGIRGAVDAFIVHWEWLNKRRAQRGTHEGPYQIAPYYFMYAHYYAARAVELLPQSERAEYRRRVNDLLFSVRGEDGAWNDRVFERSSAYGTAMATLAVLMPSLPAPATWKGGKAGE
jgi:hypothetical protein